MNQQETTMLIGLLALPQLHLGTVCKMLELNHWSMRFSVGEIVIQCSKEL